MIPRNKSAYHDCENVTVLYILNSGSHTVTDLLEMCPLARGGVSRKNCCSAEHSSTLPYSETSFRNRSYAFTMFDMGVRLAQSANAEIQDVTLTTLEKPHRPSLVV